MKISDLLTQCKISDSALSEIIEAHPKQIVSDRLYIPVWKINYSYCTARGNPKEAVKYIFREETDWDIVPLEFEKYMNEMNEKHPERKLSNVKILDTSFIGKLELEFE
jgi:hypothetical protein